MDGSRALQSLESAGTSSGRDNNTDEERAPNRGHILPEHKHTGCNILTAETQDQITPQLIAETSVMVTQSCYDRGSEAAHSLSPERCWSHPDLRALAIFLSHNLIIRWWTRRPTSFSMYQDQHQFKQVWPHYHGNYLYGINRCSPGFRHTELCLQQAVFNLLMTPLGLWLGTFIWALPLYI